MKVIELIELLKKFEGDREVVLHYWNHGESKFIPLSLACSPRANTNNLLVLIEHKCYIKPIFGVSK